MKTERVHTLTDTFEAHAQQAESGVEFWLARDLQHLLGYTEWRNFTAVVTKAKTACEVSGHPIADHFVDVNKMVDLGSGSQREVDDLMLTRYARYLKMRSLLTAAGRGPTQSPFLLPPGKL
jgi:DNA-damage-inducible protein D